MTMRLGSRMYLHSVNFEAIGLENSKFAADSSLSQTA